MSFSGNAKGELCRALPQKKCCAQALCFGILLYCNTFTSEKIKIVTECQEFAAALPKLFKRAFNVEFDQIKTGSGGKQSFLVEDENTLALILDSYGFDPEQMLSLHVNLSVLEEECCRVSFLRGAFLVGGSVTDPEKGYHLEMSTTHQSVARETNALAQEALGFYPKIAHRGGGSVLYLKQSDQISDFLTLLGAPVAAMGIMEARLEKELKNRVNRRCNCDDANTSKVVEAAQEQLSAIAILRSEKVLSGLPDKLQQAARAREENPEASLTELAAMMVPAITKPAMNHRLKKLVALSKEV